MAPRWIAPLLSLLLLAAAGQGAFAVTCAMDTVPAATLLLPYFEVDLNDPNGLTTLFSVNNAAAFAVLTHVVVWSDLAVPVFSWNVYLTGYDVQTINLRDVLVNGNLPQTASTGQDPLDRISPKGVFSQDINFASCQGVLPPPAAPLSFLSAVQLALTGKPSPLAGGLCMAQALGDNVARGYITVDTVSSCSLRVPGDPGYFAAGGTGDATNQNQLWGTWSIVNTAKGYAAGSDLVAIEADATNPATSTAGRYTFYGRYDGWSAADNREPLATSFASSYLNGGSFAGGTDLIVWRDPKVAQAPFPCPASASSAPVWYPLGQEALVFFDEMENPVVPTTVPIDPIPTPPRFVPFPAATQKIRVGSAALPMPFSFGWVFLDLNSSPLPAGTNPPVDGKAAQAYVVAVNALNGHFAVTADAFRLDSACAANHTPPGGPQ
ncbi:MAG: hypothetical protein M3O15_08130 [Acidobacteriota bacterium]|nr:hypothetical protein [Acidobacteriota bacterium]